MNYFKVMFLVLISTFLIGRAEGNAPVKADSKIDQVTVFLQGAQVERSARVRIPAGTSEVVFDGVSPHLNHTSLQAGGVGDFVIMSVRYNTEYTPPGTQKENAVPASLLRRIELTRDSLTLISFEVEGVNMQLAAWTTEKNMLERNKIITGEWKSDSLPLFIQAMEFYRIKIHEINKNLLTVKMEKRKVEQRQQDIQRRLNELVRYQQQLERENITQASHSYQVVVTVSAKAATTGSITINYLVRNASWVPSYELRANNSSSPVRLHYRALITQNTDENWDNVQIRLSTVTPQAHSARPRLNTWVLRYVQPVQAAKGIRATTLSNVAMEVEVASVRATDNAESYSGEDVSRKAMPVPSLSAFTQQNTNFSNIEFEISMRYTIPADGKAHQVTILEEDVDAEFRHYAVPKMEREAYLMARLTDWEKLSLLPGNANIYFMNTIIGTTVIDPLTTSDTLEIGLGRDPGIGITRKKIQDKEVNRMLSNNTEREIIMEITLRNRKSEPVNLELSDQIPISGEEIIKVKYLQANLSGAELNEQTGGLIWNITLQPLETKVITFTYTISHPRDKPLPVM
jgi:uncharacterized protein (TIGR02231 family)